MPPPDRADVLHATVELRTGDSLAVELTPVGLDGDGLMVYAPPFPIDATTIATVNVDQIPGRSTIDFSYDRTTGGR